MELSQVLFYGYKILCGPVDDVRNVIVESILAGRKLFVVTLNSQIFLRGLEDRAYHSAISDASFHLPDGAGVVLALKRLCSVDTDRIPGIETMEFLCKESTKHRWRVYLLGSRREVVEKAAKKLISEGVNVVGWHDGYFTGDGPVDEIQALEPDLLFVGMGVPRQEMWIHRHLDLPFKLAMGVGGSFDVIAGVKKRAPKLFQDLRLEWFYRWLSEPSKRARVPLDVARFYFKVILHGRNGKVFPCKKVH